LAVIVVLRVLKHALRAQGMRYTLTAIPRGVRMAFFTQNPFWMIYFLPTAAKSKQKGPLDDNALHPIIGELWVEGKSRTSVLPTKSYRRMSHQISWLLQQFISKIN
jgi:hypothetical protein